MVLSLCQAALKRGVWVAVGGGAWVVVPTFSVPSPLLSLQGAHWFLGSQLWSTSNTPGTPSSGTALSSALWPRAPQTPTLLWAPEPRAPAPLPPPPGVPVQAPAHQRPPLPSCPELPVLLLLHPVPLTALPPNLHDRPFSVPQGPVLMRLPPGDLQPHPRGSEDTWLPPPLNSSVAFLHSVLIAPTTRQLLGGHLPRERGPMLPTHGIHVWSLSLSVGTIVHGKDALIF